MKDPAIVNYSPEPYCVELRDVDRPLPGGEEVLVRVASVGVCGSDLHQWAGTHTWPVHYPVVLGHEFSGVILEKGSRVQGFEEGERVVSETAAVIDPDSPMSRQGRYNLDPSRRGFGYGVDGAMTPLVCVPARCLHHLPDDLPLDRAALAEPCCVAFNAVINHASVSPGDRVVVLGPGPIGLLCAAMARLQGASVALVGLESDGVRLEAGKEYGCEGIVGDPRDWARAGDGLGVHGVIDAAGVSATLETALDLVRPAGWICKVGWGSEPLGCSLDPLVQKNVTLRGSFSHNWPVWESVIDLLASGRLDVEPIVGGTWPLDQWNEAFEAMRTGRIVKALLAP